MPVLGRGDQVLQPRLVRRTGQQLPEQGSPNSAITLYFYDLTSSQRSSIPVAATQSGTPNTPWCRYSRATQCTQCTWCGEPKVIRVRTGMGHRCSIAPYTAVRASLLHHLHQRPDKEAPLRDAHCVVAGREDGVGQKLLAHEVHLHS